MVENPRGCWVESRTVLAKGNIEVAFATLRRQGRENEDVTLVSPHGSGAFVADGMGGCPGGALFASAAAHAGISALDRGLSANEAIKEASRAAASVEDDILLMHGGAAGLGLRFFEDGTVEYSSRGDVVAWSVSNGVLSEISKPQSRGFRLLDYLGKVRCSHLEAGTGEFQLDQGSMLIVMTDGAWRFVSKEELAASVSASNSSERSALEIMEQAIFRMTPDDASVLVCRLI